MTFIIDTRAPAFLVDHVNKSILALFQKRAVNINQIRGSTPVEGTDFTVTTLLDYLLQLIILRDEAPTIREAIAQKKEARAVSNLLSQYI
jgi:hypothetical protein